VPLLPEHLLLLLGFAIPLGIDERSVSSGHLFLRLPCPYTTPPILFPVFYSSHIGDEFSRNEYGNLTFRTPRIFSTLIGSPLPAHPRDDDHGPPGARKTLEAFSSTLRDKTDLDA
jgi:hypothetical protein